MAIKQFIRKFQFTDGYVKDSNQLSQFVGYDNSPKHTIELKGTPKAIDIVVDSLIAEGYQLEAL